MVISNLCYIKKTIVFNVVGVRVVIFFGKFEEVDCEVRLRYKYMRYKGCLRTYFLKKGGCSGNEN